MLQGIAREPRRLKLAGRFGEPIHENLIDRIDIDRMGHRLAHQHILKRIALHGAVPAIKGFLVVTEPDHDDAGFEPFKYRNLFTVAQPVDILHGNGGEQVDFARHQCGNRGCGTGDGRKDCLGDIVLGRVPPIGVWRQGCPHARLTRLKHERAGSVGLERCCGHRVPRRLGRAVGLGPVAVHDHPVGNGVGKDRVGRGEHDIDRKLVDHPHFGHRRKPGPDIGLLGIAPLIGKQDIIGRERRSVVEGHALAQIEPPAVLVSSGSQLVASEGSSVMSLPRRMSPS